MSDYEQARRAAKKAHFNDLRPERTEGKSPDFDAGFKAGWDALRRELEVAQAENIRLRERVKAGNALKDALCEMCLCSPAEICPHGESDSMCQLSEEVHEALAAYDATSAPQGGRELR